MAYIDDYKRTTRGRALTLLSNARKRSKERNVPLKLSVEWVEEKLIIGTCQITCIPFNLEPTPDHVTRRWDAPSLDRIDKHLPYNKTNTRVVLWAVNCALSEYGTEIMLPILKAMINGIENAEKKSTTPVPAGHYPQSEEHIKHGTLLATGTGEDDDHPHHHCGTIQWEDLNNRPETSGGDGVAHRNKKVEPSPAFTSGEDNGESEPKTSGIKFGGRHLFS